MTQLPENKKHYFSGVSAQIYNLTVLLLNNKHLVRYTKLSHVPFITFKIKTDTDTTCCVGLVATSKGVLVETAYPESPYIFTRLWMLEPTFGKISYIEIDNPDLRHYKRFDYSNPDGNAYELHAMPEDLQLLLSILRSCIKKAQSTQILPQEPLSLLLLNAVNEKEY